MATFLSGMKFDEKGFLRSNANTDQDHNKKSAALDGDIQLSELDDYFDYNRRNI
jgi:hypothetical protein